MAVRYILGDSEKASIACAAQLLYDRLEACGAACGSLADYRDMLGARLVVAKWLNVDPAFYALDRCLRSHRGNQVKVRLSRDSNAPMIIILNAGEQPADIYVYLTGQIPSYRLIGWISKEDLAAKGVQTTDPNGKQRWVVDQSKLRPLP